MTDLGHFETVPRGEPLLTSARDIDNFARRYAMSAEEAWSLMAIYNHDRVRAERVAEQLRGR